MCASSRNLIMVYPRGQGLLIYFVHSLFVSELNNKNGISFVLLIPIDNYNTILLC